MMGRSSAILSFLAFAAAAFTASGVEVVDLTLAARRAGASSYSVTTTSQGSSYQAKTAFDGVYSGNSIQAWHSVATDGLNVTLSYQFNDSFNQGKFIRMTSYMLYFNNGYSGSGSTCKMPSGWTFEGSNDGTNWTVLDTRSGLTASSYMSNSYTPFPLRTSASYRRYRFNFTGVCNSDASHQYYIVAEIRFNGCILDSEDDMATLRLWKGGATGNWEDAANWTAGRSGETPPLAGDDVVLGDTGAVTVNLLSSTPRLSSLVLGGYWTTATLSTTNWTTCIEAEAIRINGNGVVTCSPASTNQADIGRVWFKCGEMNIASGATIDADAKGYAGRPVSNAAVLSGVGPGGGRGMCGGSHGGYGANSFYDTVARPSSPYGSAEWPETPGSSGSTMYAKGASGGGVVKIEATGHVVVNGTITANGGNVSQYGIGSSASNRDGAGSGGSICITAETIAGTNGVIRANGGGGMALAASAGGKVTGASRAGCAGGGGRIALHYDTSLQRANWLNGVTVSTTAGNYSGGSTPYTPTGVYPFFEGRMRLRPMFMRLG